MIVVGVSGHRVLADTDRIREGVEQALKQIERRHPGRKLAVMSALAEGADRLVADAVLARGEARLTAVLPLPAQEYIADFASPESRAEFERLLSRADEVFVVQPEASRDESYEAAARYVLERSDILVTIWDGKSAQGQGGTGDTVARARQMGLPIAWIKAGNRNPGTMEPTTLESEQGIVVFENL